MDKQLRLLAGSVIVESKLSKPAKQQLLAFIKEDATDAQVKALLMDGKIVKLDEQAEQIVNERFEAHHLNEGALKSLFGMFLLTPVGWVAWRAIKAMVSKGQRKCGVLSIGKSRDMCLLRVKAAGIQKKISIIKSNMGNCAKAKNPEKCKASGEKQLRKLQEELQLLQGRIGDMKGGDAAQ